MTCLRIIACAALLAATATPAPLACQASTVVLVRHAEKADTTRDPDLSRAGAARADALADVLAGIPLHSIFVTQYRRTAQTADPTSRAHHLVPVTIPATGDVHASAARLAEAIRHLPMGSSALVVGHSNTLGPIIAALGGPAVADLCDGAYATLFVLELPGGGRAPGLIRAAYGAPDPEGADACKHEMHVERGQ